MTLIQSNLRTRATCIVLKKPTTPKRQHAAIRKLVEMCRASTVVTDAGRGITAEVRKDRDHGGNGRA